jgi:hypothetical protein
MVCASVLGAYSSFSSVCLATGLRGIRCSRIPRSISFYRHAPSAAVYNIARSWYRHHPIDLLHLQSLISHPLPPPPPHPHHSTSGPSNTSQSQNTTPTPLRLILHLSNPPTDRLFLPNNVDTCKQRFMNQLKEADLARWRNTSRVTALRRVELDAAWEGIVHGMCHRMCHPCWRGGMRGCKGWGDHRDEEGCVMGDYWVNLRKADWKAYRGDVGSDGCRIVQAGSDGDVNSC